MEPGFMDMDGEAGSIALRAVIENSRRARADSTHIRTAVLATKERVRAGQRDALAASTSAVDRGVTSDSVMAGRHDRLSRLAGRSPVIEEAKARLAERCGISRPDAFRLLTALSNGSNRKLRDIAEDVLRA
jgi:hypothetical protein